jgi:hypothetical protein
MSSREKSGRRQEERAQDEAHTEYMRSLVARAAGSLVEQESLSVEPDVQDAVQQTIDVHRWLIDLRNDGRENNRGGTQERKDIPTPTPPSGALVSYILRELNLID